MSWKLGQGQDIQASSSVDGSLTLRLNDTEVNNKTHLLVALTVGLAMMAMI